MIGVKIRSLYMSKEMFASVHRYGRYPIRAQEGNDVHGRVMPSHRLMIEAVRGTGYTDKGEAYAA